MMPSSLQQQQAPHPWGPIGWPVVAGVAAVFWALAMWVVPRIPTWTPAAFSIPLAALILLVARKHHMRRGVFFAACMLASAGWATWTTLFGISWLGAVVWGVAVVGGMIWAVTLAPDPNPPALRREAPTSEHPKAAELRRLLDRLLLPPDRAGGVGVEVTQFQMWPKNGGYDATVEWPRGHRITFRRVKDIADDLAAEMRLDRGCPVRIKEGGNKGQAIVSVTLINHLAKDVPYPTKSITPRSLRTPVRVGFYGDDSPAAVDLYQTGGVFCAAPGGGKTVLIHNIIGGVAECADSLLWVVDLNGGGVAVPWLRPYARDEVDVPVIDWIASSPEEALVMADTALAIAKDRKSHYAPLCAANDTDILPISAQIPAVTILIDEGGEVFGAGVSKTAAGVAEKFLEVQRIARAMCMRIQVTVQRGTYSYLPSDLKKVSATRACGPVEGDEEIAHVLDWDKALSASDLGRGEWFLRRNVTEPPAKMKTYAIGPSTIREIVQKTEALRPSLDERGQQVGGRAYAQRWDRARPFLRAVAGHPPEEPHQPLHAAETDAAEASMSSEGAATVAAVTSTAAEVRDRIMRNLWGQKPTSPAQDPTPADDEGEAPDWVRDHLAGLAALPVLADEPTYTAPEENTVTDVDLTDGQKWVLRRMAAAGPAGARTLDLCDQAAADQITTRRQSISEWIAALRDAGYVTACSWGAWAVTDTGKEAAERLDQAA